MVSLARLIWIIITFVRTCSVHPDLHHLSNSYVIRMRDEATLRHAITGSAGFSWKNLIVAPILTVPPPPETNTGSWQVKKA
jgi:hypothetical protein